MAFVAEVHCESSKFDLEHPSPLLEKQAVQQERAVGPLALEEALVLGQVRLRAKDGGRPRLVKNVEIAADPVSGITEFTERERMDVIALATHGHGGPVRFLLGSVADKLVRSATVPLLVWRPRLREKAEEPMLAMGAAQVSGSW